MLVLSWKIVFIRKYVPTSITTSLLKSPLLSFTGFPFSSFSSRFQKKANCFSPRVPSAFITSCLSPILLSYPERRIISAWVNCKTGIWFIFLYGVFITSRALWVSTFIPRSLNSSSFSTWWVPMYWVSLNAFINPKKTRVSATFNQGGGGFFWVLFSSAW